MNKRNALKESTSVRGLRVPEPKPRPYVRPEHGIDWEHVMPFGVGSSSLSPTRLLLVRQSNKTVDEYGNIWHCKDDVISGYPVTTVYFRDSDEILQFSPHG